MKRAGFYFAIIMLAIFCLGPFLWQVVTSLKPEEELTSLPPILPSRYTFSHFLSLFKGHPFLRIIINSIMVAGFSTILSLIIGSLAAFSLAKLEIKGKGVILGLVLSVSMFPAIATVGPIYIIIRALGLRDTWWALIITYTTFSLPITIWVLTNFFKEIPHELYLASRIDGCTNLQFFYKVLLPLSTPGLLATAILVFIFSWNEFLFALTFTSTIASRTIPVEIALFPGLHEIPWGDIAAASVIVTVPLIFLVFVFQRRIVEGLTAGAIKG